jgi:hypothetical protein
LRSARPEAGARAREREKERERERGKGIEVRALDEPLIKVSLRFKK